MFIFVQVHTGGDFIYLVYVRFSRWPCTHLSQNRRPSMSVLYCSANMLFTQNGMSLLLAGVNPSPVYWAQDISVFYIVGRKIKKNDFSIRF